MRWAAVQDADHQLQYGVRVPRGAVARTADEAEAAAKEIGTLNPDALVINVMLTRTQVGRTWSSRHRFLPAAEARVLSTMA